MGDRCVRSRSGGKIRTSCGKFISPCNYGISDTGNCVYCGKQLGTDINLHDSNGDIIPEWNLFPISYTDLCRIVGYSRLNFKEKLRYLEERKAWYSKELKNESNAIRCSGLLETINDIRRRERVLYNEDFERRDKIEREQRKIENQISDIATFTY